jgi:hypothetical protein
MTLYSIKKNGANERMKVGALSLRGYSGMFEGYTQIYIYEKVIERFYGSPKF